MKSIVARLLLLLAVLPALAGITYLPITLTQTAPPVGFQTTPTLLYTDIVSGPTSGGESNKGAYITACGYAFGTLANLGTSSGAKLFIGSSEVDNYRTLTVSRTNNRTQTVCLRAQIGALGGQTGALDVKVTVNGTDTNILTGAFTPQPGRFWFVDNVSGSDSTGVVDDITKPFRYLQAWTGSGCNFTGLWSTTTTHGDAGLRAGDTIVLRAGTWVDQNGYDNNLSLPNSRWMRFCGSHTGTAPTGSGNNGYITVTSYPGEAANFTGTSGGGGGLQGPNGADENVAGQYFVVSNLKINVPALTADPSSAPIDMQFGANFWRIVENDLSWPSTSTFNGGTICAKAGGISGTGHDMSALGNYIHDIGCNVAASNENDTNHGIYIGGDSNSTRYFNMIMAYNVIEDVTGGNGIQMRDDIASMSHPGNTIHHNWIKYAYKRQINIPDNNGAIAFDIYDNVLIVNPSSGYGGVPCVWFENNTNSASNAVNVVHNTCVAHPTNFGTTANRTGFSVADNMTSGFFKFNHNVVYLIAGSDATSFVYLGGSAVTTAQNLYYDVTGQVTTQSSDATGVFGNPLFTNTILFNFTLGAGSPGLAACTLAEVIAVPSDFFGIVRPVPGTGAPGGTKNDIGFSQGIGT